MTDRIEDIAATVAETIDENIWEVFVHHGIEDMIEDYGLNDGGDPLTSEDLLRIRNGLSWTVVWDDPKGDAGEDTDDD